MITPAELFIIKQIALKYPGINDSDWMNKRILQLIDEIESINDGVKNSTEYYTNALKIGEENHQKLLRLIFSMIKSSGGAIVVTDEIFESVNPGDYLSGDRRTVDKATEYKVFDGSPGPPATFNID